MRTSFPGRQVMPPPPTETAGPVLEAAGPAGAPVAATPVLFQFLHGQDAAPKAMTPDEIADLGDAFTQHVLPLDGAQIPLTLQELVTAIESATAPSFPLRNMFMVDEGAIPHGLQGGSQHGVLLDHQGPAGRRERPAVHVHPFTRRQSYLGSPQLCPKNPGAP